MLQAYSGPEGCVLIVLKEWESCADFLVLSGFQTAAVLSQARFACSEWDQTLAKLLRLAGTESTYRHCHGGDHSAAANAMGLRHPAGCQALQDSRAAGPKARRHLPGGLQACSRRWGERY
jgi:hypothetical protein